MSELSVPGIRLGVAQAGIKYANRDDLTLIEISEAALLLQFLPKMRLGPRLYW